MEPVQVGSDHDWVCVSGGVDFSLALKADGTLWGAGFNTSGQLGMGNYLSQNTFSQVGGDSDWVMVSCGNAHVHAIKGDGTLWSWGSGGAGKLGLGNINNVSTPTQVGISHNWTDVSAGTTFGIGVQAGGRAFAWGSNTYGQLGIGNNITQYSPVPTSTPAIEWINISAGGAHTVAVRAEGSLWSWGHNNHGQLGLNSTTDYNYPVPIDADTTWVGVAAGDEHTLAIKANGSLWAWGYNTTGQLGNGNTTEQHSPVQVGADSNWVSISAGHGHSVALKSNGTIWAWGDNSSGQLGTGNNNEQHSPVQVGAAHDWIAVQAGLYFTLALKADGTLWAWGQNTYGQLGTGNNTNSNVPVQVGAAGDWTNISAGGDHSIALKSDGTLWAWGLNTYGQLGTGNNTNSNVPVQVGAGNTWIGATTGQQHSFAFKTDGTASSWGMNTYGQLGLNNNTDYNTPQPIPAQAGVVQLFCGSSGLHSTLIKDARDLVCLAGRNTYGQLGDNSNTDKNNYNCIDICNIVTPTFTVNVSPNDSSCTNQTFVFTGTQTNGGPTPTYQWYVNGVPVGNSITYTNNSLVSGDVVSCTMTSSAPCAFPSQVSDTITIYIAGPPTALAGTPGNTESTTVNIAAATDVRYPADCDLMATVTPAGASPVSGNTTVKVTLDNAVNNFNGQPYVQRHFDIEPALLAPSATADIKLYVYQSEFDAYNTVAAFDGLPLLPTGAVDNGNVLVTQFHGTGTQPANYTGGEVLVVPSVSWDAAGGWWVLSFPVTGFSGFYIHTASGPDPLAIKLSDIAAQNLGAANRIDWKSSSEEPGDTYILQRSADGRTFSQLATVPAKGKASSYSYRDEQPYNGINYYRILLRDVAGNMAYSKVVSATVQQGTGFDITVAPNPAHSSITVRSMGTEQANANISISDMTGRVLLQQQTGGSSTVLDISALPEGIYMLRYSSDAGSRNIRFEKTKE